MVATFNFIFNTTVKVSTFMDSLGVSFLDLMKHYYLGLLRFINSNIKSIYCILHHSFMIHVLMEWFMCIILIHRLIGFGLTVVFLLGVVSFRLICAYQLLGMCGKIAILYKDVEFYVWKCKYTYCLFVKIDFQ